MERVSRSGFHARLKRPRSAWSTGNERLRAGMRRSFRDSVRTYGARRIWRDTLEEGLTCGLHRIARVMKENGLRARPLR